MEKPNNLEKHKHFIIFKPYGYLSQFVNNQTTRKNKKMLGELYNFPENAMAIGRLDEPSEGLLLLTTDGKASEFIRSSKIEKEYYAQVDGKITSAAIEKLKNGVKISTETGKYLTKNCAVKKLETPILPARAKKIRDERHGPTSWISVTLREGKFRQIRKMTAVVGFPTLRLVRVRIGKMHINNMKAGEVIKTDNFL
ncbi:MAG: pseudouridine synthase [Flavobacteriaceae bacterium]|nr:MAG: pseudouridine synthase [Flavobacteriaceae bacterium]